MTSFVNTSLAVDANWLASAQRLLHAGGKIKAFHAGCGMGSVPSQTFGSVRVIGVMGFIAQRPSFLSMMFGGTSTEEIGAALDDAAGDGNVKTIVLNIESPGGSVFGVQELADKLTAITKQKQTLAVANSYAASAAYWIASQAGEVVVTPSGQVGSIGVIAAHTDTSQAEELAGVKTTLITAGKFKGELDPSSPLTDDARAALQQSVDGYYAAFTAAVARGRGTTVDRVRNGFGQGRMLLAADAVKQGLADRVASMESVLREGPRPPAD